MPIEHYLNRNRDYYTQIDDYQRLRGGKVYPHEQGKLAILQNSLRKDDALRQLNSAPTQTYLDQLAYYKLIQDSEQKQLKMASSGNGNNSDRQNRVKVLRIEVERRAEKIKLCEENIANSKLMPPIIDDVSVRDARIYNLALGGYITKTELQEVRRNDSLKEFISDPKVYNLLIKEPIKFTMNMVLKCSPEERRSIQNSNEDRMLKMAVEHIPQARKENEEYEQYKSNLHTRQFRDRQEQRPKESDSAVQSVVKPVEKAIVALKEAVNDENRVSIKNIVVKCIDALSKSVTSFLGSNKENQDLTNLKSQCKEHVTEAIVNIGKELPIVMNILQKLYTWAANKVAAKVEKVDNAVRKLEPPAEVETVKRNTLK